MNKIGKQKERQAFLDSLDSSDIRKMLKEIGIEETYKKLLFARRGDFAKFCKRRSIDISIFKK